MFPSRPSTRFAKKATAPKESTSVSYFRTSYTSFEEFRREALVSDDESLGKEELELLMDLEDEDLFDSPKRRRRRGYE